MNQAMSAGIAMNPKEEQPMAEARIDTFDFNLKRMTGAVDSIENKCHYLLNLRQPQMEGKPEAPLETDFIAKIDTRMNYFANLNERLERINQHLAKIVG